MQQNRELTELRNIGKKIAERLRNAGINNEEDSRLAGAVSAHCMLKEYYPNETLPVCYYLYSFEGALHDLHWNDISEPRKCQLREEAGLSSD